MFRRLTVRRTVHNVQGSCHLLFCAGICWSVRACVILVEFSDVKFSTPNPQQYFNRWLNEEGFSENSAPGSVRDYFINQSEGQFIPHFDVYGPVTMSYTRAKNSSSSNAYKVIHDAAGAIDSYVDFADYDVNGDGYVDNRAHGRTHE